MTDSSAKTGEIKDKVEGAKRVMDQNITLATQRGEALEDLQDKTRN
jgi:ornithine cyclodeaminase/alanine dehydrogenase-like protein (mu-crystallin family)